MTATYGFATNIEQVPFPAAAVNIVSSTNASPTVITATAHGLHTGSVVIINGHLINTAANGIRAVTVLTVDTFKISTLAGFPGTFINGVGVGGATGTVQSLDLPGVTLPQDTADPMDAASVNVPFEALLDMTADLAYRSLANTALLKGGRLRFAADARDNYVAPTRLTDANHGVLRSTGPVFLLAQPTAPRVITVGEASDTNLENGDQIEFSLLSPAFALGSYALKRESAAPGTYICTVDGAIAGADAQGYAKLQLEGGVWRLRNGYGLTLGPDA